MRAIRIALGTDGIDGGSHPCQHGNDGGDSWREDGANERAGFRSVRFDAVDETEESQSCWS